MHLSWKCRPLRLPLALVAAIAIVLSGCDQPGDTGTTARDRTATTAAASATSVTPGTSGRPTIASSTSAATRPTTAASTQSTPSTTAAALPNPVAIGSLSSRDVGRTVTVTGMVRQAVRQSSGHIRVTLADTSGNLRVYIRRETGVEPLALSVGEAYAISGRIQTYEGRIELVPGAAGDVRLTDGYDFEPVEVLSVIDGDTVRIRGRDGRTQTLRIIGVDTPERAMDGRPAEFHAAEATAFTERTLKGRTIYLERDNSEVDQYNRLLRYVWLAEPAAITPETLARDNFSAQLLQNGFAEFVVFGSDNKYATAFEAWARQAKQAQKGMWARR